VRDLLILSYRLGGVEHFYSGCDFFLKYTSFSLSRFSPSHVSLSVVTFYHRMSFPVGDAISQLRIKLARKYVVANSKPELPSDLRASLNVKIQSGDDLDLPYLRLRLSA
jgi:hypothetical protein